MVREGFVKYMKDLEKELTEMNQMVITALQRSIEAMKKRDIEEAKKIIADDSLINKKRWDIEDKCINLIATQQPVASDLREIIAVLNMITDLERMGDHAEGIAKIVLLIGDEPPVKPLEHIPQMAEITTQMLKKSLDSFINRDADAARAICDDDDKVDALYDKVYQACLEHMIKEPKDITKATHLIWVAHNIERTADRVTNICERIVFLVKGSMQEMHISSY
jgi:phosphate transport system protein